MDCNDAPASVISLLRKGKPGENPILVACNFTPVPRLGYMVGVPAGGYWKELLNSVHENFVLPFTHDEVVHGKGSMLSKMPGDEWQRFANLRLLFAYMFAQPAQETDFYGLRVRPG